GYQTIIIVGLVGYLSIKNGEKIVTEMINKLSQEIATQVAQNLDSYLELPQQINQSNFRLIKANFLNLDNLQSWEFHLWQQIQDYPNIAFIAVVNPKGEYRAGDRLENNQFTINRVLPENHFTFESFNTNDKGEKINLFQSLPHKDIREQIWYKNAVINGKAIWSDLHISYLEPLLLISNLRPIDINNDGSFDGFLNTTIKLDQISDFLSNLKLSQSSQVFIVNNRGELIANSTRELPFNPTDKTLLLANHSQDKLTQFIAESLTTKIGNFQNIKNQNNFIFPLHQENYFTEVIHYQHYLGLDWFVVVVIPQSDFMAQINANTKTTIFLCILGLLIAIFTTIFISRWLAKPIQELAFASDRFSQGNLTTRVKIQGVKELTNLSQSFNYMAEKLLTSLQSLEKVNNDLENRVLERTQQLTEAKNKAEVANQAKSTFLANMSHELRTPLNAILGFAQLMMRSPILPPQDKEKISIINRSGEYLLTLINNVLDLAKIEAGKTTFNPHKFDLYHLLEDLEDFLKLNAEQRGLQLIFEGHQDIPRYIETDSVKLRQVLINLLSNALKFTKEGGVNVFVTSSNYHINTEEKIDDNIEKINLIFEISDTGAGIPENEVENLFKAFYQTDTGKNIQEGTGLGLVISRQFIKLMGGDITVKSEVGVGTTFIFNIVVTKVDPLGIEKESIISRVIGLQPHEIKYRILVVDDKEVNCQLLNSLLTPIGFEVQEAYNGQQAVQIWEECKPHPILRDRRMLVMDGYEQTKAIKRKIKGNATAVIALTASVLEEEKVICLSAGCDDFLRKPFRQEAIFNAIGKHLGVKYLYEADTEITVSKNTDNLSPKSLAVMSQTWLQEIYQATLILDEDKILSLIAEIPNQYSNLANSLQALVNNFQLEEITNLIDSINQK
ncbi:ATP-binding protein, partial [Geminocystis sp. GBBB08]|uniref:hybrid sensor histidine kinase/response regulator n=1 Tax=Geminocystis sp. GBBB08 TaxID=2604140 RepID=UPI0027E3A671